MLEFIIGGVNSDKARLVTNGESDGVETVAASTPAEEAEYVAARILSLVRGGMKFRDIAVFTRDINEYYPVLESAFERSEIPFFADKVLLPKLFVNSPF